MSRQMTLPCTFSASMSYLQVPGQGGARARLQSGGMDTGTGQERRRLGHQASIESYYSFASEGDGDIFGSRESVRRGGGGVQRQTSFCIPDSNISEYSEFNEDFHSSISDLFRRGRLENQGTFSEQGSIRSLSIDQEEITFELPGMRAEEINADGETENVSQGGNPNYLSVPAICEFSGSQEYAADCAQYCDEYEPGYMSSSCSISMSSDLESSHQITVPVYVEPAPPEIRFYAGPDTGGGAGPGADLGHAYWRLEGEGAGAGSGGAGRGLQHQETLHTDSGLDTEEICPATPTGGRFSAGAVMSPAAKLPAAATSAAAAEENLRLVLVRDIGIQCSCAESPSLSTPRHRRSRSAEQSGAGAGLARPSSLSGLAGPGGKFQSELLF